MQGDASSGTFDFESMLQKLGTPPLQSSARFNPAQLKTSEAVAMLQATLPPRPPGAASEGGAAEVITPQAYQHPALKDVVVIDGAGPFFKTAPHPQEVTVGLLCGMAVLRGAHVFAPGVLGYDNTS